MIERLVWWWWNYTKRRKVERLKKAGLTFYILNDLRDDNGDICAGDLVTIHSGCRRTDIYPKRVHLVDDMISVEIEPGFLRKFDKTDLRLFGRPVNDDDLIYLASVDIGVVSQGSGNEVTTPIVVVEDISDFQFNPEKLKYLSLT